MSDNLSMRAAQEINNTVRYTMFTVFSHSAQAAMWGGGSTVGSRRALARKVEKVLEPLEHEQDLKIRGWYDLSATRANADLMVWWHAPQLQTLQDAYRRVISTDFGLRYTCTWSAAALHRQAEFNAQHIPDFMADTEPKAFVCVYPFVRSYEWYLLPDEERRNILADHGRAARDFPDVRANTVSAFGLGDYEWILAFEADDLTRIVDLMRVMRATEARRHVRVEIPFHTGPRVDLTDLLTQLP